VRRKGVAAINVATIFEANFGERRLEERERERERERESGTKGGGRKEEGRVSIRSGSVEERVFRHTLWIVAAGDR